jgi:hypothetical protein
LFGYQELCFWLDKLDFGQIYHSAMNYNLLSSFPMF